MLELQSLWFSFFLVSSFLVSSELRDWRPFKG